jgi:hypothetical protein
MRHRQEIREHEAAQAREANRESVRWWDLDSPRGCYSLWFSCLVGAKSKAKNSKVAQEYAEHKEHDEFILVRASGE